MSTRIPRHQALAEQLLDDIGRGRYPIGERLPTETELASRHRMARGTVRQALDRLERLGMIERRPSLGTVVVATRPDPGYQPAVQSIDDIRELAATTRLLRPEMGEVVLDGPTAARLELPRRTAWYRVAGVRVRRDQPDQPLCWSEHYLRADLPRGRILTGEPPGAELARYRIEQTIDAALLTVAVAEALGATPASAALVITRRLRDPDDGVINVGQHIHPADRYRLTTIVAPGQ